MEHSFINHVQELLRRVKLVLFEKEFEMIIRYDQTYSKYMTSFPVDAPKSRIYIQIEYKSKCNKGGDQELWRGRKFYLSHHMIDDEIIKTAMAAWKACILHEVTEGFLVDGVACFNNHVDFEELIKIANKEVKRQ